MSKLNPCSAKRSRMDQSSDFFDDDFDGDAIEDCFKKAIQEKQSQSDHNASLASYSIFKEPKPPFTSTQVGQASGSNQTNMKSKMRELEAKYVEKEGEVSILRTNFENLRASCHVDQEKKQSEWNEKLAAIDRKSKGFRSELELKNLEIANLKHQMAELSKLANVETSAIQKSYVNVNPEKEARPTSSRNSIIYINQAKPSGQKRDFTNWLNRFETATLNLQNTKTEAEKMIIYNDLANFDVPDALITAVNSGDLSIEEKFKPAIVWPFFHLMKNFRDCLKEIEEESSLQSTKKCDREGNFQFLQNTRITKVSLIISKIIALFGDILPRNSNLRHYFLSRQSVHLAEFIPREVVPQAGTFPLLNELSYVISGIKRVGKEKECSAFLSAVLTLLYKIIASDDTAVLPNQPAVDDIITDLLLLKHEGLNDLIDKINRLLNVITQNDIRLCSSDNSENTSKKGFCRFRAYITSIEGAALDAENHAQFPDISESVLDLTYSILGSEEAATNKACSCISKLAKLTTGIIYSLSSAETALSKNRVDKFRLLVGNAFEVTQKDMTDVAQFKEIMYRLNKMENGNPTHLEKVCLPDDFAKIPKEKFANVNL